MKPQDREWIKRRVLENFISYVKIDTTSNPDGNTIPTTGGQRNLANILRDQLFDMGITNAYVDENSFVIARLRGNRENPKNYIGLLAHMDTSPDVSGKDVKPIQHRDYNGKDIELPSGVVIKVEDSPHLKNYVGDTVITSDGSTLLGADDKAGIAEIMTAVEFLIKTPDIEHIPLEIIFTPDEETGLGMSKFPKENIKSKYCYTVDGGEEGSIENETFNAYRVDVEFKGRIIHPGYARGRLKNSITMATKFLAMIPESETPEATDAKYGYYYPYQISGNTETTSLEFLIRDFDDSVALERIEALKKIAEAVEAAYRGAKIRIDVQKQYTNMGTYIKQEPRLLSLLEEAVKKTGLKPIVKYIRGGTDGSRLSEMGIPTPNIFTGGHNFHSRTEWIALGAMVRTTETLIHLATLWAKES